MKWTLAFLLSCAALSAAELSSVRAVYVLPMGGGMDQYLASQLTRMHTVQVVADPKLADAVLTDRIGPMFETRMDDLFPPAPPAKPEPAKEVKKEAEAKETKPDAGDVPPAEPSLLSDTVNKVAPVGAMAVTGRGKGTIFLVDAKTREVLWSTYQVPDDRAGRSLDKAAARIVVTLKKDLGKK